VRNAAGASLTTNSAAGPTVAAASSEWAERLDEMQYAEHEGPCLDAARTSTLFRIRDVANEPRWPSYMPRALGHGALSMVSIPMTSESKTIGALNVYSREVDAFGPDEVSIAEIIAGHASLAAQVAATLFGHRNVAEQLRIAMASRATIEQAKGIIMAATGGTAEEAFEYLKRQSQHENIKLRELADEIVARRAR
jgi:GAF domain-containing protein